MLSKEERKAIERIEDFLTTNIIISISSDETANSEELKAFISKNEYLSIEFIASMFLKQSKEIEELKDKCKELIFEKQELTSALLDSTPNDKIKAKIDLLDICGYWEFNDTCDLNKCIKILHSLLEEKEE